MNGVGGRGGDGGGCFANPYYPGSYPSPPGLLSCSGQVSPCSSQPSETSWQQSTRTSTSVEAPKPIEPLFNGISTDDNTWSQYVCAVCGEDCKTSSRLRSVAQCPPVCLDPRYLQPRGRSHFRYHVKPFGCSFSDCAQRFSTLQDLERHVKRTLGHGATRACVCPESGCGKRYTLKYNLQRHMKKHKARQTTGALSVGGSITLS